MNKKKKLKHWIAIGVVGAIAGWTGPALARIVVGDTSELFLFWLMFFVGVICAIELILLHIFAPKFFKDYFSRKD